MIPFLIVSSILLILILGGIFVYFQNYKLQRTDYKINFSNLPNEFEDYKILHLSDIHRKSFGKDQKKLIKMIRDVSPDIVVVSGDIIYCYNHWYNFGYSYDKDLNKVMKLFDVIAKEYPVYYAPGNHECKSKYYPTIREKLINSNVIVLDSDTLQIEKRNDKISLIGLKDPTFWGGSNIVLSDYIRKTKEELITLKKRFDSDFTILISHRPEIFNIYKESEVDLVFTGHAHGGQWIFPFIGPVFAPQQGYFPKYTSGVHKFGNTNVVISRGMGNSSMPIRLFNRPEVVVVTLKK